MALSDEQWRFAIEDARTRHEAVVSLLYANDTQAMSLLTLCVTLGLATAAGSIASLGKDSVVPHTFAIPLGIATALFAAIAYYCFIALKPATVNLPGRDPDFWLWAGGAEPQNVDEVYQSYLTDLEKQRGKNNEVNTLAADALRKAKFLCAVTPIATLIIAIGIAIFT